MVKKKKKIFVLDTNVILHDSSCMYHFQEHTIVIPITVLEELDHFKKGEATIHFHAREFVRALDALSGDRLFDGGVPIGNDLGNIIVKLGEPIHKDLTLHYSPATSDHHILNTAYCLFKKDPTREVILVSKDVNLRMKAKSVGLKAQDYTSDHVKDVASLYEGYRVVEHVPSNIIDSLYRDEASVDLNDLELVQELVPHEYLIMRNGKKSVLGTYDPVPGGVKRVEKTSAYGITPRNAEQTFALHALMDQSVQLVTVSGKAGTGKTLLALAAALEKRKQYRQIFIARPIVALSNRDIGYLPGDIQSKLDPYMQPLYDNLSVIQNQFSPANTKNRRIKAFIEEEKLVVAPLAYLRGRSLVNIYFIVDEAQNLTPHEVKTIITRAGEGTKMVFTGDIFQIDHPYLNSHSNGLSYLISKMQGRHLYSHISLQKGERSELAEMASDLL